MGKEKYLKKVESLFSKSPLVSYSSIDRIVGSGYTKRLVNELLKKGKIKRISKGHYTSLDDSSLAVFCFKPAYLGLQDAMSLHGIWEQETIPVVITARKIRTGMRKILGSNVLLRRIDRRYLFGVEYYQEGKIALPYSDIEKTFIDMVYFNENIDKKELGEFMNLMDLKKLNSYLKKYPKMFRIKIGKIMGR